MEELEKPLLFADFRFISFHSLFTKITLNSKISNRILKCILFYPLVILGSERY